MSPQGCSAGQQDTGSQRRGREVEAELGVMGDHSPGVRKPLEAGAGVRAGSPPEGRSALDLQGRKSESVCFEPPSLRSAVRGSSTGPSPAPKFARRGWARVEGDITCEQLQDRNM